MTACEELQAPNQPEPLGVLNGIRNLVFGSQQKHLRLNRNGMKPVIPGNVLHICHIF